MASPPVIKIAELIAPITGAEGNNPAGVPMPFAVEQDLDNARKDYEQGPTGNRLPKKAEWDTIVRVAAEQLKDKSKDLRLAIRLAEGLVKKHGIAGLRDGLTLIRTLIEQCWDRFYPVPNAADGEDMTIRGELLSDSLSDPDAGFTFPHTIRAIPVVALDNDQYSLQDKLLAEKGKGPKPKETFSRAKPISDHLLEDWKQAGAEVKLLRQVLDKKLEGKGPSFQKLDDAVEECLFYVKNVAPEQAPPPKEEAKTADNGQPAQAGKPATGNAAAVTSREEAYRQISQIANVLEKLEPHSPIPDLLRRTVELGKMPFRELIRELVREDKMIKEIYREYGIEEKKEEKKTPDKK